MAYFEDMSVKESKKFINKLHPNLWSSDREHYESTGRVMFRHPNGDVAKYRNIKSIFGERIISEIKQALDEGRVGVWYKDYTGDKPHLARDYRVELNYSPSGIYQGFFFSNHSGFETGDFYLLLNESTAVFAERC